VQNLPTTGTIDSRLGRLELVNGFPSDATVKTLYDALDFQRACQAYLWALPYMAMAEMQREQRETFGAGNLDYVDYFDYKDKLGILTANATTPYTMAFPNLAQTGPLVFEIPAGEMAGGVSDFWQRPLADMGQTGPDRNAGGRFLILGPNDKGPSLLPAGYYAFRSPTNNVWVGMRALGADRSRATALTERLRIYPYAQRDNPPPTRHLRPEGRTWTGEQPRGLAYWELLARVIGEEPAHERDRLILAMLVPLGIEKGKPFTPDERQRAILADAATVGEMMARANSYAKRFAGATVWPGTKWEYSLLLAEPSQEAPNYTQLDERSAWFYEAAGVNVGMMGRMVGVGQVYLESQKDSSGAWLDGGRHYSLHVPENAPVAQFWSCTVYDNESRCMIDTGSYPDRSSRDAITLNADGSADLYFGPTAPAGAPPTNWIKTLPDKGWFTYFRLYGPTAAYFGKTWVLPDIVRNR